MGQYMGNTILFHLTGWLCGWPASKGRLAAPWKLSVARSIQPNSRRPNQASVFPSATGFNPTDRHSHWLLAGAGSPIIFANVAFRCLTGLAPTAKPASANLLAAVHFADQAAGGRSVWPAPSTACHARAPAGSSILATSNRGRRPCWWHRCRQLDWLATSRSCQLRWRRLPWEP